MNKSGKREPKKYTKKVVADIIEAIENDVPLDKLYRSDTKKYPSPTTILGWTKTYPEFKEQYLEARVYQASTFVEKYNDLADNPPETVGDRADDSHNRAIWDRKLRVLEFKILKLGKIFDAHTYGDTQTVKHEGLENLGPQILIMDYGTEAVAGEESSKVKDITPSQRQSAPTMSQSAKKTIDYNPDGD